MSWQNVCVWIWLCPHMSRYCYRVLISSHMWSNFIIVCINLLLSCSRKITSAVSISCRSEFHTRACPPWSPADWDTVLNTGWPPSSPVQPCCCPIICTINTEWAQCQICEHLLHYTDATTVSHEASCMKPSNLISFLQDLSYLLKSVTKRLTGPIWLKKVTRLLHGKLLLIKQVKTRLHPKLHTFLLYSVQKQHQSRPKS